LDESLTSSILLLTALIGIDALITLAYASLINARQSHLRESAENDDKRAQQVLALIEGKSRLNFTYKLTTLLLYFMISGVAVFAFVLPLFTNNPEVLPLQGFLILIVVGAVTLVIGDVVPESIGSVYADALCLLMVTPMRLLVIVLSPLVALLLIVSRVLSGIFGSSKVIDLVTEEEIMTIVSAGHTGGTIEEEEKDMIYSILQLDETVAREMMTPRMDIIALEVDTPLQEALPTFINSGYTRIPVFEENIDNIVGLLYAKDLLTMWKNGHSDMGASIRDLVRPAYFVPESKAADALLKELQTRNVHMSIVVDEYGGTSGLVTIEDMIEEIVGDIRDEYDLNEEAEYVLDKDGAYHVDTSMDLDDFNDLLDINLETDEADTLGGYIYLKLGRVPDIDEVVETDHIIIRVTEIDGRRIRKAEVTIKHPEDETEPATEDNTQPVSKDTISASDTDSPQEMADAS